jgi:hypothetical protein
VLLDTTLAPPQQAVPGWKGPVDQAGDLQVWRNPAYAGEARLLRGDGREAGNGGGGGARGDGSAQAGPAEAIALRRDDLGQRIDVDSLPSSSSASTVVTDEQWDAGWTAEVDGHPAPVRAVDGFFLGVDVPPGAGQVTFHYRPVHARLGLATSGSALLVTVLLAAGDGWPLRRPLRRRRNLGSDAPRR